MSKNYSLFNKIIICQAVSLYLCTYSTQVTTVFLNCSITAALSTECFLFCTYSPSLVLWTNPKLIEKQSGGVFYRAPHNERQNVQTMTGKSAQYTSLWLITHFTSLLILWCGKPNMKKLLRVTSEHCSFDLGLLNSRCHTRSYRVFRADVWTIIVVLSARKERLHQRRRKWTQWKNSSLTSKLKS